MSYEEMSDFEINKRIAKNLGLRLAENQPSKVGVSVCYPDNYCGWFTFNPCNDPSDSWCDIIDKNKMKLDPRRTSPKLGWMVSIDDQIYSVDKNPLRAAMICFLRMKDAERES